MNRTVRRLLLMSMWFDINSVHWRISNCRSAIWRTGFRRARYAGNGATFGNWLWTKWDSWTRPCCITPIRTVASKMSIMTTILLTMTMMIVATDLYICLFVYCRWRWWRFRGVGSREPPARATPTPLVVTVGVSPNFIVFLILKFCIFCGK